MIWGDAYPSLIDIMKTAAVTVLTKTGMEQPSYIRISTCMFLSILTNLGIFINLGYAST